MRSSRFTSETRGSVQPQEAMFKYELRSSHPMGFKCHCEQFMSAVLFDHHCNFQMTELSIFIL